MASFGKFEAEELEAFIAHFDNFVQSEQIWKDIEAAFQKATGLALNVVKKKTPVAKSNSWIGLRLSGNTLYEDIMSHRGGSLRRGWKASEIQQVGDDLQVELYNTEEYAIYVELGHRQTPGRFVPAIGKQLVNSWVPGTFMLQKSLDDIQKILDKIIDKAFRKALEDLLGE